MNTGTPLSSTYIPASEGTATRLAVRVTNFIKEFCSRLSPQTAVSTRLGRGHTVNQDAVMARNSKPFRSAVADGISSCWKSEIASQLAVDAFKGGGKMDDRDLLSQLLDADRQVKDVFSKLDCSQDDGGQSTLLVANLKGSNRATLLHVGDSRGYQISRTFLGGYRVRQITTDQTVNGVMYQAIGFGIHKPEEILHYVNLSPGDMLVLATDGLFKGMDNQLANIADIAKQHRNIQMFATALTECGSRLCKDDVSVAVIRTAGLMGVRPMIWLTLLLSLCLLLLAR